MDESRLREVTVTRSDDRGYGLTVSGESPVTVQEVKDGGPASLAGVQAGDCIIKVNGTPVSKFNHKEVVQIIKSSHSVRLTVCSGSPGSSGAACGAEGGIVHPTTGLGSPGEGGSSVLHRHHNKDKPHNIITAPLPVNNQLQTQLDVNRHKMLSKMLDTQLKTRESILVEMKKSSSKSLQKSLEKELDSINRQVATIDAQLHSMREIDQLHSSSSSSCRRSPAISRSSLPYASSMHHAAPSYHPYLPPQPQHQKSQHHLSQYQLHLLHGSSGRPPLLPPPSQHHHPHLPPPLLQQNNPPPMPHKLFQKPPKQHGGGHQKHTRSASEIPPPLPARNRNLFSQISAPNMSMSMSIPSVSVTNAGGVFGADTDNGNIPGSANTGSGAAPAGSLLSATGTGNSNISSTSCDNLHFPSFSNINQSSNLSNISTIGSSHSSTTTLSHSSLSSTSTASTSLSTASNKSKSSSFNMKGSKGSSSLSASPSCVSTMSAPPNLCPPPLPPRPPNLGGRDGVRGPSPAVEGVASSARQTKITHSVSSVSDGGGGGGSGRPTSQHCRAKSSPEAITPHTRADHGASGRLTGSDSLVDLTSLTSSTSTNSSSSGGGGCNRSSSTASTGTRTVSAALLEGDPPPGTPPPPYAIQTTNNNNDDGFTNGGGGAGGGGGSSSSDGSSSSTATTILANTVLEASSQPSSASSSHPAADGVVVDGNDNTNTGGDGGELPNSTSAAGGGCFSNTEGGDACVAAAGNRVSGVSVEEDDDNYCTIPDEFGATLGGPLSNVSWSQNAIQSMEDDFSDQENCLEDHGPFQSLSQLWTQPAYLAVFMNYVISNCGPSTLFFYMLSELYKEGAAKEMKKWAYEIHSSFLLPGAPMLVACQLEDTVLHEIDETLRHELDKEETLRKVFLKARQRARDILHDQLADFRAKRTAGLGNIFGPADPILQESKTNKNKEMSIVENLLVPFLESVSEELKGDDQNLMVASSLATILWKWFNVRSQKATSLIDRCPLFVNKDRPLRSKLFKVSKKQLVREHCFNQLTYYSVTYCNHCQDVIWGVAPQGYQCANCEMNIHKSCAKLVEELCIGQVRKKPQRDKKLPSFLGKIIPEDRENKRKSSQIGGNIPMDKRGRGGAEDDAVAEYLAHLPDTADQGTGNDRSSGLSTPNSISAGALPHLTPRDSIISRRSDSALPHHNHHSSTGPSNCHTTDDDAGLVEGAGGGGGEDDSTDAAGVDVAAALPDATKAALRFLQTAWSSQADAIPSGRSNLQKKKSGNPINRSESYKDKHHQRRRTGGDRRKHSDPSIPSTKSGDVDTESGGLHYTHSGSSSNSSLSQSLDSPSLSLEQVTTREAPQLLYPTLNNDSDVEVDADLPDWTCKVGAKQLDSLNSTERKRQETINELFHTEQTHVRLLKVMYSLFYNPLKQSGLLTGEQLNLLFPNLDTMLNFHSSFNEAMKKRRRDQPYVQTIGDILVNMFEGQQGDRFKHEAAVFVRSQSIGLEGLKLSKKRDQKLATFLQERENHQLCRRLQLKDMLPAGFQRLSKYPLLLESLLGYTDVDEEPEEHDQISRCLDRSREVLASVNAAVREEENHQRLIEIQKRLDQSTMTKNKYGRSDEVKGNLDLTKHRLIYEGPLTWRLAKGQKNLELHVLVLDVFIVLLQRDNDKYILKNYSINKTSGKEDKLSHSPVINFGHSFLYREVATDKCAFFIVTTQSGTPQIYELVTPSDKERKIWFKHLQDSAQNYDNKDCRNNRRSQPPTALLPQHDHDQDQQQPQQPDGVDDGLDDADCADSSDSTILAATPTPAASNNNNTEPSSPETINQRTESTSTTEAVGSGRGTTPSATARSRLQEVSIIQIVEDTPLISPSEVTVSQGVVLSAQPVLTPIEHLRRKDLKIKQALEEKQHIIADILGIPREHFETLGDMAGESSGAAKEPRELVLAALYQANCLQDALNDALNIKESDIVAAKATAPSADKPASIASLPLYPAPMNKLMNIAGSLSQQLNLLLNIVSERDDERDRMRRELVASRERLHQLHMSQSSSPAGGNITSSATPTNSRPSSLLSQGSTVELGKDDDAAFTGHTHEEERTRTCSVQEELSQVLHRETSREDKREGAADESGCPSQQPEAASADTTTDRGGDADATSPSPNT